MDAQLVQEIVGQRYRIRRLLGRGGMSTVWLADDTATNKLVAVKLLNQELSDNPEFRQRFQNEAAAARSVSSPNVVRIVTYQESRTAGHDACYIVMEYIRGESLSEVLQRLDNLPEHLVIDVIEQTAHGLSAIHAAGLIHRDIKPGNLLVTPEGTVKITDFGIAKAAEAVPLTRTGMVVGTAQYVSPEQAQGKSGPSLLPISTPWMCGLRNRQRPAPLPRGLHRSYCGGAYQPTPATTAAKCRSAAARIDWHYACAGSAASICRRPGIS